jgi:hypothetical protein
VGGRIVHISRPGKPNILKVDPSLLSKTRRPNSSVSALSPFKPWNGHTVWAGPQNEWWLHQTVCESRKRTHAAWPPDPYLEKAAYTVTELAEDRITMVGPASPVCGLRFTKRVVIDNRGGAEFTVSAENTRATPLSWDLWLNTRLPGYCRCYVPVHGTGTVRVAGRENARADLMASQTVEGFFTFDAQAPTHGKKMRWAKAFIHPSSGMIAGFNAGQALIIAFRMHPPQSIHKEQAQVEIYNSTTGKRGEALLELEYHAPYRTLEPGESMVAREKWDVQDYRGRDSVEEHLQFLQRTRG